MLASTYMPAEPMPPAAPDNHQVSLEALFHQPPLGYDAGSNLYRYAANNPINKIDPSGLLPQPVYTPVGPVDSGSEPWAACRPRDRGQKVPPQFVAQANKAQDEVDKCRKFFLKCKAARELLEKAEKALGEKIRIKADTKDTEDSKFVDENPPTIYINPNAKDHQTGGKPDCAKIAAAILFEALNAAAYKEFLAIQKKAEAGDLSRIDFVVAMEKVEYDNTLKHHEIAAKCSNEWGKEADIYKDKAQVGFDKSLMTQIKGNHSQQYGKAWDKEFGPAWKKKHPNGNPDTPADALTKGLKQETINALQKALSGKK